MVIIKRFEPATHLFCEQREFLESRFNYPDRYRLPVAFMEIRDGIPYCKELGRNGSFAFPDNFCPFYLGQYPAVILGETDLEPTTRDWFLPYD